MKKPLAKWILSSMLAGVVLNVLVALICTLAGYLWPGAPVAAAAPPLPALPQAAGPPARTSMVLGGRAERFGYSELRLYVQQHFVGTDANHRLDMFLIDTDIIQVEAGWPAKAFRRRLFIRADHGVSPDPRQPMLPSRLRIDPWQARRDIVFPIEPVWRGVLWNTLLYAMIAFVVVMAFQVRPLRLRLRLQRGLCPRCAYPIGVNERCTECGEPLSAAARLSA